MKSLPKCIKEKRKMQMMLVSGMIHLIAKYNNPKAFPEELFYLNMLSWAGAVLSFAIEDVYPRASRSTANVIVGMYPFLALMLADSTRITATHTFSLVPSLQFVFGEDLIDFAVFLVSSLFAACALAADIQWNPQRYESRYLHILFENEDNRHQVGICVMVAVMVNFYLAFQRDQNNRKRQAYEEDLLKLNHNLKIALQEKENFILRFSHEIRNPLNSLLGNIDLLNETNQSAKSKQMLSDAKVCGEILLQLLNNILDSAKVSMGKLEVAAKATNTRKFFERLWTVIGEMIRSKNLYGALHLQENVPELLMLDNHRMMQIMINLISNATKFTDKGFVTIHVSFIEGSNVQEIRLKPSYLSMRHDPSFVGEMAEFSTGNDLLETEIDGFDVLNLKKKKFSKYLREQEKSLPAHYKKPQKTGYLRIEVSDSGCGIEDSKIKHLFSKFSQVSDESTKRQIGTGLGLWITKEIVELLNGDIKVFSGVRVGTSFSLAIKTETANAGQNAPTQAIPDLKTFNGDFSSYRVLVMEDNPYNQEVNRKFLMQLSITASVASNGLEGVKIYKEKGEDYFDFIISDLDMPVMDGFAACREIRRIEEQHNWHQCPIAVLTGHANDAMRIKCVNEEYGINAFRFFPKPVFLEAFKEMAQLVLSMKQQGVELAFPSINPEFGVLVADDDAFNRKLMSDIISKFNCKVFTASNGRAAFEEYLENQKNIFLVLMDCEMPVMNGIDSTKMILESEKQRVNSEGGMLVKIIGLTGFCDQMTKKRCLENGMIDVITKPIDINALKDLIEKYRRPYLSQFR